MNIRGSLMQILPFKSTDSTNITNFTICSFVQLELRQCKHSDLIVLFNEQLIGIIITEAISSKVDNRYTHGLKIQGTVSKMFLPNS